MVGLSLKNGLSDPRLEKIAEKIDNGERLGREDGLAIFETNDMLGLGRLADYVNQQKNHNRVYYINNLHINYSNVCAFSCKFCAFYRHEGRDGAYFWPVEEVLEKAAEIYHDKATEWHIVGGCHPKMKIDYYCDMVSGLRKAYPKLHVQAFTAVEIDFIAQISKLSVAETLTALREAGLGSLPGGGAEIFAPEVRKKICPGKSTGERYLDIHRTAHNMGIPTNCTMLYGHIESYLDRVDHMLDLRALQDETGKFNSFIPLLFHPQNTKMEHLPKVSGVESLKTIAAARLLLDNFNHIKSFWIMLGIPVTQMSMYYGSNDVNGTVVVEKIIHEAGAETPQHMPAEKLEKLILDAGRIPVERDTLYNPIRVVEPAAQS